MKKILIGSYAAIASIFALYGTFFGAYSHQGFAANLGRAVVWPAIVFPSFGKLIGSIVLLLVLGAIFVLVPRR